MIWQTFIPGVPKPQGSKSAGVSKSGRAYLREDNTGTKPWRKIMVARLQDDHGKPLVQFDSAVWVRLRFVFLRPKSHRPDSLPTSKALGDVDKLTRNVLDALTQAKVITDDKFVVKLREVEKVYGPNPGAHIEIGSAVPNPFGGISTELQGPVGGPCSCHDRCRGHNVCRLLTTNPTDEGSDDAEHDLLRTARRLER